MADEEWHKMDQRYRAFDKAGNQIICECPDCKSTDLLQVGWLDDQKREKQLQCQACGTKF